MKIHKKEIYEFIRRGKEWNKYAIKCAIESMAYQYEEDERYKTLWESYAGDMKRLYGHSFGTLLLSLIDYCRQEGLKEEDVINALRALNLEVE